MNEIVIDKLSFGGSGLGRIDGKACFVPLSAPGDHLIVNISKNKRSYSEGIIDKIVSSSSFRIVPTCPFFGICGGCNWQHIDYDEQCRQKEQIVCESLWRGARVDADKVKPILHSPYTMGYRQRIQLKAYFSEGRLLLGFHKKGSHIVVDVNDTCLIASPSLNLSIPYLRRTILNYSEPTKIPQIDLSSSSTGSVSAIFHYIGESSDGFAEYLKTEYDSSAGVQSVGVQFGRKVTYRHLAGLEYMHYMVPNSDGNEMSICYSPDGFSQVNFSQNRQIVSCLTEIVRSIPHQSVLDLYCGNGNFSLPLAAIVENLVGYENFEKSVEIANFNASQNSVSNAKYLVMDSAKAVMQIADDKIKYDLVLLDPPRTGAVNVAENIHKIGAAHIIYVSCDPMTLSRDLAIIQKNGYEVLFVQPFDMFPQTYHIETLTLLKAV